MYQKDRNILVVDDQIPFKYRLRMDNIIISVNTFGSYYLKKGLIIEVFSCIFTINSFSCTLLCKVHSDLNAGVTLTVYKKTTHWLWNTCKPISH